MANWRIEVDLSDLFREFPDVEDFKDEAALDEMFKATRDKVVERLDLVKDRVRAYSRAPRTRDIYGKDVVLREYEDAVDGLRFSDDLREFNAALDELFDWADEDHRMFVKVV